MEKIVSLAVVLVMALFLVNADPMVADAACVAPPSGLVSWWGGDNNALDIVGTNHATLNGATYAPGKVGQAFSFDGNGAFASVPASTSWAFGTGDFAISFWAYGTTFDDRRPLINNRRTPASDHMWAIEIYPVANRVEFHSGLTIFLEATNLLNGSSWNHIVVTRSGSTLKMFINGVPSGSVSNSTDFSEINDLQIGRDSMSGNQLGGRSFPGLLDEVQIFNHALSESDVAAIFGAGSEGLCRPSVAAPAGLVSWWPGNGTADDVVGTNNGTLQGGTAYAPGKVGQGFSFDGTDDFVHVPSPAAIPVGNSSRTITAWVKSAGGTNLYQGILGYGTPAPGQVLFFEWGGNDVDLNRLYTMNLAFGGRGATLLGYDTWYHVALTHDGSNTKLYVNGQLDENIAMTQNTVMNSAGLRIGRSPDFDGWHAYFKGVLDEVAIFGRALTVDEIASIYNAGSSGMTDLIPDAFTFTPVTGAQLSTFVESNPFTVTGINTPSPISITGGEYSISSDNGVSWTPFSSSTPSTVSLNNQVKVRRTSAATNNVTTSATLTIGGASKSFEVTTLVSTPVSGTITGNVTWSAANSPYLVTGDLVVNAGATLSIEAGTVIKLNGTYLQIFGTLIAPGTSEQPIYFTSYHDDSVGGDSNGNGGATLPAPGNWISILVNDGSSVTLSHCTIRYAGAYLSGSAVGSGMGGIYKHGSGNMSVDHCAITDNGTKGVWLNGATGTVGISDSTVSTNTFHGIYLTDSTAVTAISGNTIQNNTGSGIFSSNSSASITGNTVSGNSTYGIYVTGLVMPGPISGNTLNGNTVGPIGLHPNSSGVTVTDDNTFSGPLVVEAGSITRNLTWGSNRVYYVNSGISITGGNTLTIPAGRIVKLSGYFYVNGTLNAPGTAESPIYFTSIHDDSVGGDSNGNGSVTTPAPGNWVSIVVTDGGSAALSHSTVRYAGAYLEGSAVWTGMGGVCMSGAGSLNVDHCSIIDNGTKGIWLSSATGTVSVTDSTVRNNTMNGFLIQESPAAMTISGNSILNNTGSGISVSNSSPSISGNTISGNSSYGIYVVGLAIPASISNNVINTNISGSIGMDANSSGVAIADDNTFTDGLRITGSAIDRDISWSSNWTYSVMADISINPGKTLTIPAGRVVKFNGTNLSVNGTLNAQGSLESPVNFTSYHDDSVGGDSNGNGGETTPAAGNWSGIITYQGGATSLTHCVIRYGGGYVSGSNVWPGEGNIVKFNGGTLAVSNSMIRDSVSRGIWLNDVSNSATITDSVVSNNAMGGIMVDASSGTVTLSGNSIQNNSGSGIAASNSSPVINGNLISANSSNGISLSGALTTPQIINNRIYGNPTGILCDASANPVIGGSAEHGNEIYGNSSYGVRNTTSSIMVDASHNWWGSATGPAPAGSGNAVSEYVNFEPFLTSSFHTHNLAITFAGTGGGTVEIAPSLGSGNSAWTTPVSVGEAVTLTAQPAVDGIFAGWSGGTCSGTGTCTFPMNGDVTITATFTAVPPVANFSGTPLSGVEPLIVSFTDTTAFAPYSWNWNFGDGGTSSVQYPGHDYTDPGTYAVSLTATNAHGSDTETKTGYINVSACPKGPASVLSTFFDTLQLAYDAAGSSATIKGRYKTLGSLNLKKGTNVTLKGGYDCPHETVVGITTLTGALTITTGSAVVENIAIK